ncbi:thermonuclease family protein [Salipiger pallidus]|nr:thermonuclease family protein [Salipiger pallidus]
MPASAASTNTAVRGAGPTGAIHVIDGDTIDVDGARVRLHGIDTPEQDQMCGGDGTPMWACGAWVSDAVRDRYEGREAICEQQDLDRYGRIVARCLVDGQDMGRVLVQDGLAFAYRRYSMAYDLDEKSAVIAERGLHGSGVELPSEYRANARAGRAAVNLAAAPAGCVIKGNISSSGERIYHVPGQQWYEPTRIDETKGERWFCSEADARAAGWRRAQR